MKSDVHAFPTAAWEYDGQGNVLPYQEKGMTLRDYFAAKAMQGFIMQEAMVNESDNSVDWLETIAKASYEMADAMLKAREAK